jgi:hypothetical protein
MYPTVEVRWFYEGMVSPAVMAWFQQVEGKLEEQPCRVDYYLRLTDRGSLGIKLREGKVEIKQRYHQHGVVGFHERVSGLVEHWRKWSFELVEASGDLTSIAVPASSWIAVKKERKLRKYGLTGDKRIVAVSTGECHDQGCDLELTKVSLEGREWWSLGLEAFGHESALQENLLLVARQVFVADESPAFDAKNSYGYPQWLQGVG